MWGGLIVPILIVILNNRLAKLKHDREIKAEFLKLAEDLEGEQLEKRSTLYKDRLVKSAFNDDAITYSEVKFFLNYENADLWVRDYVKIRGMFYKLVKFFIHGRVEHSSILDKINLLLGI